MKTEKLTKKQLKSIERGMKDIKEGRTYIFCCAQDNKKPYCSNSKQKLTICFECHIKDCERWYRIGLKDGRRKVRK